MSYNITLDKSKTKILSAASGTGAGGTFASKPIPGSERMTEDYSWAVVVNGGPPASLVVNLEISADGTNWFQADQYTGTTNTFRSVAQKPFLFIRANITTFGAGGGTVDVLVII